MTDTTQLEDDIRRALRRAADDVVVDDRAFDPSDAMEIDLDESPMRPVRRMERRVLVAAAVVVVLVAAAVVVHETGESNGGSRVADSSTTLATAPTTEPTPPATAPAVTIPGPPSADLVAKLTASVPTSVLDAVGAGSTTSRLINISSTAPISQPPLSADNGKPRVLWIGAEYCPFCAAQRWPLIVALSRFGTFSNLGLTSSAATTPSGQSETDPDTQSFTFHGSTYASPYVSFEAVEEEDRAYKTLDTPTAEEQAALTAFDAPPWVPASEAGSIPFVEYWASFVSSGSAFDPLVLQGKTALQIATALSDPTTDIAKAVDGSANMITAALCAVLADLPASICRDPVIAAIQAQLPNRT
jgi:hypothetical protein